MQLITAPFLCWQLQKASKKGQVAKGEYIGQLRMNCVAANVT